MDKRTLIARMISENNGKIFISKNKAMKILGRGEASFDRLMSGVDYRVAGKNNAHEYLVDDVAEAVMRL